MESAGLLQLVNTSSWFLLTGYSAVYQLNKIQDSKCCNDDKHTGKNGETLTLGMQIINLAVTLFFSPKTSEQMEEAKNPQEFRKAGSELGSFTAVNQTVKN